MLVVQKALLLRGAAPAKLHAQHMTVGKIEFGDVERIAEGMFGNMRVRIAVHAAAGIGRYLFDFHHRLAKPAQRRGLHRSRDPLIERGDDRAGERRRRTDFDRTGRASHQWPARRTKRPRPRGPSWRW